MSASCLRSSPFGSLPSVEYYLYFAISSEAAFAFDSILLNRAIVMTFALIFNSAVSVPNLFWPVVGGMLALSVVELLPVAGGVMLATNGMAAEQFLMDRGPSHVVSGARGGGC